jgi:CelD/BcsL family acetyltransferase involved in cellulose biosynthesis
MKTTVQRFTDPSVFDSLRSEWTALESRIYPRTPFCSPLWHETWWSHLRRKTWHTRDDLAIYTVRDTSGQLIGIAPYMHTKRPGLGFLQMIELQGLGADPHVTELRGIVCEPHDQPAVMQALRESYSASYPRPSWITWHNVRWSEGPQKHSPPVGLQPEHYIWTRPQPAYLIDLPESWSSFEASLTKRVRKKIRNCYNQLTRDAHVTTLNVVSDPALVGQSVRAFYDLVAVRSEIRHANPFGGGDVREFFDDYAQRSARQGELRVFELRCRDQVVAARIGFVLGDQLYLYHSGNLPSWDRFSIMTTLLVEIFKWAIKNSIRLVNLSTGHDRSKTRWRPREIMFVDAIEIMPGRLNGAIYHAYKRIKGGKKPVEPEVFQLLNGEMSLPSYDTISEAHDE